MIDHEKLKQAVKLLEESGAVCILAYENDDGTFSGSIAGNYSTVKSLITGIIWEIMKDVRNDSDDDEAISELLDITHSLLKRFRFEYE
jgi:hypothetical protein